MSVFTTKYAHFSPLPTVPNSLESEGSEAVVCSVVTGVVEVVSSIDTEVASVFVVMSEASVTDEEVVVVAADEVVKSVLLFSETF